MAGRLIRYAVALPLIAVFWVLNATAEEPDPVTTDPVRIDGEVPTEFSAAMAEVTLPSHGMRLAALMYMAAGEGPHPTVILLHGYPGNEKNLDLAQGLRRAGWNVFFFHYRGAWGSEGEYSYANAVADVQSAIDFLRTDESVEKYRIDRARIVTVGHSLGGHMAMEGVLNDPGVACVVYIDGVNLGRRGPLLASDPEAAAAYSAYSDGLFMLRGWSGEKAVRLLIEGQDELELARRMEALSGRPVLLIAGGAPGAVSIEEEFLPLIRALKEAGHENWRMEVLNEDHLFSSSRIRLARLIASFLNNECR